MLWKAAFFYVLLVALLRLMGKREIGSLSAIDLVVFIMISEAAIISIEDKKVPLLVGVTPVLALAALEILAAWISLKNQRARAVIEGKPSVLIAAGRIDERELRSLRFNLNDLQGQLRQKNIDNLLDVEYAILETSGKLSIVPKADAKPVTPKDLGKKPPKSGLSLDLVVDGRINHPSLKIANKDEAWLRKELGRHGANDPADVFFASLDPQGKMFVQLKETKTKGPKPATLERSGANGGARGKSGGSQGGDRNG